MIQTLSRRAASLGSATNYYLGFDAKDTFTTSNGIFDVILPFACTIKNLRTTLSVVPGGAATRTIALRKNGTDSALTVTHAAADTTKADTTNSISCAAGDRVVLHATMSNTPATSDVHWTIDIDSDTTVRSMYGTNININKSGYVDLLTGETSAAVADCKRIIPYPGNITAIYTCSTLNTIQAGDALTFYLYLNGVKQDGTGGTINTATVLGSGAAFTVFSSTFVLPVVRGDYVYVGVEETISGTPLSTWTAVSMRFEASTAGVSMIACRGSNDPNTGAAYFHALTKDQTLWVSSNTTATQLYCGITPIGLSYFIWDSTVDPGAAPNTRTLETLKNGSFPSGGPSGVVSTGVLRIDDTSGTVSFATGDAIGPLRHTPASTPTTSGEDYWSFVMHDVALGPPNPPGPPPTGGGFIPPINAPPTDTLPLAPKLFVHLVLPNANQYCFSEIPLNDAGATPMPIGGYKVAKLMVVSDVEREFSETGYKTSGWSFTIADLEPLRAWRNIALTETIEGATAALYAVDDVVRLAGGQPYMVACGVITHHEGVRNSIKYTFDVEDALGARLTAVASDPKIPSHPLLLSEFPGLDPSQDGKFGPIAIGKLVSGNGMAPGKMIGTVNLLAALGGPDVDVDVLLHSEFAVAGVSDYYYTMSTWGPEEAVTLGWFNRPTPNNATGLYYIVTVAGTTGTTEPTWPPSIGGTVSDGSVTWQALAVDNPDIRFVIPSVAYDAGILTASFKPNFNIATNQANQYLDYPVGAGARRYGVVTLIRHSFIYARAIREGRMLIVADIYGVTPNADGSGNYVDTHEDALVWITAEMLFFDSKGTSYATMPQINGYDVFNDASRVAAKAVAAAALSGGFIAGFMLGRGGGQQSGFNLWQELQEGGDLDLGPSRFGQVLFGREDVAATAVIQLNDLKDLISFNIGTNNADNKNWQQSRFGYRYVPEINPVGTPSLGQPLPLSLARNPQWESGTRVVEDVTAQANVGGGSGGSPRIKRTNFDNYTTNDSATALIVMQRKFARYIGPSATRDGQKTFVASGGWGMLGLGAVKLDLGSVIGLTSGLGFGSSGFVAKTGRILKVRISLQKGIIEYSGSVLYPYIATSVT